MKRNRIALLVLLVFTSVVAILCLAGCPPGGDSPDFAGTWVSTTPPMTITMSATTLKMVSGVLPDTETVYWKVTDYDTTLGHIYAVVTAESYTGTAPGTPMVPGDKGYLLYSISGTTLTMAAASSAYPADLGSAYTFVRQ